MSFLHYRALLVRIVIFALVLSSCGVLSAEEPSSLFKHSEPFPLLAAKQRKAVSRSSSPLTVKNVRYHDHKSYTRVVLDLPAKAKLKESKNQKTATIELANSRLSKRALRKIRSRTFPQAISIQEKKGQTVKVTLTLSALKKYELQTLRRPNRVVIDLFYLPKKNLVTAKASTPSSKSPDQNKNQNKKQSSPTISQNKKSRTFSETTSSQSSKHGTPSTEVQTKVPHNPSPPRLPKSDKSSGNTQSLSKPGQSALPRAGNVKHPKDLVVVIDPGHGGKDPGAIGKKGTKEKHVTLQIGKYLKDFIQTRLGAKVLLTRTRDVFLDLEQRVEFANKNKADLFISIHVNSHPQKSIKGLEVYHFGKASDPRALEVAARENGLTLEDNAPPWQFIIADKLNDQKIEESQTLAWTTNKTLVQTLKTSYNIKDHGVKTAPFYVLRFTTMPSILAEVAFVSNPEEENRLRSKTYQKKLAEGIFEGIQSYLKTTFPTLS